jgi:hypothetical protein
MRERRVSGPNIRRSRRMASAHGAGLNKTDARAAS